MYQVDYGEYLQKCKEEAPERMTCVLCKSGMYQIAEKNCPKRRGTGHC
nr:hypothetical protein [Methanobacterium formicicum]